MPETDQVGISVVIPVYGCASYLGELHERLTETLREVGDTWEIIFVDDCSSDGSWEILRSLAMTDRRVVALRLSRNFGQQMAITAGLAETRGAHAVVMDCDLQDPPEVIPALLAEAEKGADIVLARRKSKYQSRFRHWANRIYFSMLSKLARTEIEGDCGSLSLISRQVIEAFKRFTECDRHYLFILRWLGFEIRYIDFERARRADGRSAYTFGTLIALALSGIFFQTTVFLRWVIYMGLAVSAAGIAAGIYYALNTLLGGSPPPGWTSLIVINLFLGGIIIISVGIVGLYVARIFEQSKGRPLYVVDRRIENGEDREDNRPSSKA